MNEKLKDILAKVFNIKESEIHLELTKEDVGTWDSLKQMDLVVTLEREYSMTLEITDIVKLLSVKSIVEVLLAKGVDFED